MSSDSSAKAPKITLIKEPAAYFKDMVDEALDNQKIKTDVNIEYYLVNLLSQFMRVENLYQTDQNSGALREEALANLLKVSLEAIDYLNRQKNLKKLGDIALYTAGFFSESLARKTVDVDYYIDMGKTAYNSLSKSMNDEDFARLFSELSNRFEKFVDVLAEISDKTRQGGSPQSLLRMYELWLKTNSERAAKQLKDAGIIPSENVKIKTKQ